MRFKKIGILIIILFKSNLLFTMETLPIELKSDIVTQLMTSNYNSLGHELKSIAALKLVSKEFNVLSETFERRNKYTLVDSRLEKYKKPLLYVAAFTYNIPQLITLIEVIVDDGRICVENSKPGDFDRLLQPVKENKVVENLAGMAYIIVKEAIQSSLSLKFAKKTTKKLMRANALWFEKEHEIELQNHNLIKTEFPFHIKLVSDNTKRIEDAQKARNLFLNYCEYCDSLENVKSSADEERRQIIVHHLKAFIND